MSTNWGASHGDPQQAAMIPRAAQPTVSPTPTPGRSPRGGVGVHVDPGSCPPPVPVPRGHLSWTIHAHLPNSTSPDLSLFRCRHPRTFSATCLEGAPSIVSHLPLRSGRLGIFPSGPFSFHLGPCWRQDPLPSHRPAPGRSGPQPAPGKTSPQLIKISGSCQGLAISTPGPLLPQSAKSAIISFSESFRVSVRGFDVLLSLAHLPALFLCRNFSRVEAPLFVEHRDNPTLPCICRQTVGPGPHPL